MCAGPTADGGETGGTWSRLQIACELLLGNMPMSWFGPGYDTSRKHFFLNRGGGHLEKATKSVKKNTAGGLLHCNAYL